MWSLCIIIMIYSNDYDDLLKRLWWFTRKIKMIYSKDYDLSNDLFTQLLLWIQTRYVFRVAAN